MSSKSTDTDDQLPIDGRPELEDTDAADLDVDEIEGEGWNGWQWYPTPRIPGICAQWVDDVAKPTVALVIRPAYDSEARESGVGRTITGHRRRRRGYVLEVGPTDGDGRTNIQILNRWGDWNATPRETEQSVYSQLPRLAVAWMQSHRPEEARASIDD